ncbi:hypothetical protein B5807_12002 [Epicoccum nigrum]|uniref:Uncharacterized protein n=1 Tax=Epicoccum nigrum TaxID=105696 RepID=A0A1Y2LHF3_EPING|nr:hypothetical protein B5807_12002 [Epicoccum nigrum]
MLREIIHEIIPHARLVLVPVPALPRKVGDGKRPAALEHERNAPLGDARLRRVRLGRLLELLIRDPVRHHAALEAHAAGLKAIGAAAVVPVDEPHQLRRGVAVEVGGPVRVGGDVPAGGEDEDVGEGRGGIARRGGEHAEDGGVHVVDGDGPDVDELGQVVLVRHVVAVPRHHVEGRVLLPRREEAAPELVHHVPRLALAGCDLVARHGVEEVARVGQPVGAQRPQLGELEPAAPDLEDVAAAGALNVHLEPLPTLDHAELPGLHVQPAELGLHVQRALLGHDAEVAVRVCERAPRHARVARVHVRRQPLAQRGVAGAGERLQPADKVDVPACGDGEGRPGQLRRGDVHPGVEGEEVGLGVRVLGQRRLRFHMTPISKRRQLQPAGQNHVHTRQDKTRQDNTHKPPVRHRRPHPVQPRLLVRVPRRHKRRPRQLLRVQPEPHVARAVLALRDGPRDRLGLVDVVEARHVLVGIVAARAERRDAAVLLRLGPVEDVLVRGCILGGGRHGGGGCVAWRVPGGREGKGRGESREGPRWLISLLLALLWLHTADAPPLWGMWMWGALAGLGDRRDTTPVG